MRECWINVYKWIPPWDNVAHIVYGIDQFKSREAAMCYMPSMNLTVVYRIHVRLKASK